MINKPRGFWGPLTAGLILISSSGLQAAQPADFYTIYLVRHAEKDLSQESRDPPLTACGKLRANHIARQLQGVALDSIYSTHYQRTQGTAAPTAARQQLSITDYHPDQLAPLAKSLQQAGENTLVVGHSNTTNVVAGLLAGVTIEELDETEYDRLYQVTMIGNQAQLQLLHQGFDCP
jgi:broad specificity phosphatase PhoE